MIMRRFVKFLMLSFCLAFVLSAQAAETTVQPFVLAYISNSDFKSTVKTVEQKLQKGGFKIVGVYNLDLKKFHPYQAATVICVTSPALLAAAARTSHGGYGAVESVSVTKTDGQIQVAYLNPVYYSYAYRMHADLQPVLEHLGKTLGMEQAFGKKMTPKSLENYHYTFGMEYFNEPLHLKTYASHAQAVAAVRKNLQAGKQHTRFVYEVNVPGTDQTVFGVGLDNPNNGNVNDAHIMQVVDFKKLKGTAYLPYQILVMGNKVEALNLRFRLAVFFPGLSMMGGHSFMSLMSAPDAIKNALTKMAGGSVSSGFSLF